MHDKIREFERLSGLEIYGLGKDRAKWEAVVKKYTELVVRECADVADKYVREGDFDIAKIIKRNFGVEE
jgi:hypothetical protein